MTSIINLAVISLERLHATFCPLRHRVIKKWVYGVVITVIWLTTTSTQFAQAVLKVQKKSKFSKLFIKSMYLSYFLISLFVICVSYISIFIKVRCGPHPQHHGATNRDRKLTASLLVVTLVSILTMLPWAIYITIFKHLSFSRSDLPGWSYFHMKNTLIALAGANSLFNPIVYAVRMPQFRAGVAKIFRKAPHSIHPAGIDLPLQNLDPNRDPNR